MNIFRKILLINSRTLGFMGWGIFVTIFSLTESQGCVKYSSKYMEINVCSIRPEMKVLLLHEIRVWNISMYSVNKYVVHNF